MTLKKTMAQLQAEIEGLRVRLMRAERQQLETPGQSERSRRALLGVLEDEQLANEARKAAQERLDGILHSIDQAIWSVDAQSGEVLYLNRAAETIYGWPVQAFFDQPKLWFEAILPEDRQIALDMDAQVRAQDSARAEHRILRPDGGVRWIRNSASLVRGADRRPLRVDGVVSDITVSRQAAQAVAESEQQFRGIVEQSIAGLAILQDGKFVYLNARCAEILGYASPDELVGRDPLSLIPEPDRERVARWLREEWHGAESVKGSTPVLRKDGVLIEVGAHATRSSYRGRLAIISLVQDISEKKRADEQIQRYTEQIKTAFVHTVEVAMNLSEMRDPYTAGHERRVAEIAVAIGAEMGFDAPRREGLRVAGYLHDVGKISIPAELLSKPGKLSAVEFSLIKSHAEQGFEVLKNVEFPWPVAQVALQHHERVDGSGYPRGLKGEEILLEARIMAVADVMEAMSSHRPYRVGLGIPAALAEIERGRGTAYDADAADACLRLFREKQFTIPA